MSKFLKSMILTSLIAPRRIPRFLSGLAALFLVGLFVGCAPLSRVEVVEARWPVTGKPVTENSLSPGNARGVIERAQDLEQENVAEALGLYVDLARAAMEALVNNPENVQAREVYNFTVGRIIDLVEESGLRLRNGVIELPKARETRYLGYRPIYGSQFPDLDADVIPVDELKISGKGFHKIQTREGVGAPVVISGNKLFERADELQLPRRICAGATAILRFEGDYAILELRGSFEDSRVTLQGREFPLAANFTAPLAYFIYRDRPQRLSRIRLLRPDKYKDTARLARLQPWDPDKTPVIFVHGLQDTPATFVPMLNSIVGEEDLRERYQFWVYSYPSGYPFPYSASLFREELEIAAGLPGFKEMILVGHSMGGLVSRLIVTDPGMDFWFSEFQVPPEDLPLDAESRQILVDSLIFEPNPHVSRVIFFSTPHRGSEFAINWIGRLGSMLVSQGEFFLNIPGQIFDFLTPVDYALHLNRMPNSIDTLAPNSRILLALDKLPMAEGLPYHTVAGDRGRDDSPDSSDGIVPYWSSHLEGAVSEKIVPSGHGSHKVPEGIAELKRILREHR